MWQEMFHHSAEYFLLLHSDNEDIKKKKMLLLLRPSPVMDFLVDHGVLWAADLTQHLGFGKIQWNASQNQAL